MFKTPTTKRYEEECAQNLGDRLSVLEERMGRNEAAVEHVAKVQEKAVDRLSELKSVVWFRSAT